MQDRRVVVGASLTIGGGVLLGSSIFLPWWRICLDLGDLGLGNTCASANGLGEWPGSPAPSPSSLPASAVWEDGLSPVASDQECPRSSPSHRGPTLARVDHREGRRTRHGRAARRQPGTQHPFDHHLGEHPDWIELIYV